MNLKVSDMTPLIYTFQVQLKITLNKKFIYGLHFHFIIQ